MNSQQIVSFEERSPDSDGGQSDFINRPIHILLLSPTCNRMTGADRDWVNLLNALGPRRIRVSWAGIEGCEYLRPYLNPDVVTRLIDIQLPWFTYLIQDNAYLKRSAWLWAKIILDHANRLRAPIRRLREVLKHDPIDIVVSNTAAVTIGALFAQRWRLPHIWSVKECLDTEARACRSFATWVCRLSKAVVVPSEAAAKSFPKPVNVLPDGSDIQRIRTSGKCSSRSIVLNALGLPVGRPVVAQVAGLVWWKGHHVTAEAFVQLAAAGGKPDFSLVLLGDAHSDYRERVERILSQAPSEWRSAVRFVQFDPDDFSYLASADIVVHPSVLPDPFPNAVREAMILGKPVIASRGGGIPEMIRSGTTGILVEPGDASGLAQSIRRLVAFPEERLRIGRTAERFAITHFDIHLRKQAFYDLFQELSNDRRKADEQVLLSAVHQAIEIK